MYCRGLADCYLNTEERGGAGASGQRAKAQRPTDGVGRVAIGYLADALVALPHIEQLHLHFNSLGRALLLLPPRLPHLHTLNIAAHLPAEKKRLGVADPAPVAPMLAQLLPRYPTLTELDIGRNALEVEDSCAAEALLRCACCAWLRAVPTRGPCWGPRWSPYAGCRALGEGQAMAAFWRALPQLRTLRRLDLHHTRLDAPAVAALCKVGYPASARGRKKKKGYAPLGHGVWGGKQCRVCGTWPLQHHYPVTFSSLSSLGCQLVQGLPAAVRGNQEASLCRDTELT